MHMENNEIVDELDALNKKIMDILKVVNERVPKNVDVNLLDEGYIDSFDVVNIISDLEVAFDIEFEPEDIIPENFQTIACIAALIMQRMK